MQITLRERRTADSKKLHCCIAENDMMTQKSARYYANGEYSMLVKEKDVVVDHMRMLCRQ